MLFDDAFEEDEGKKEGMALAKTTVLYAVFLLPVAYIFFFVVNKAFFFNPYAWISVLVHEFGHFLFLAMRSSNYLHVLGGTLLEYAAPALVALIFARHGRNAAIALILVACIGSELHYTAAYMQSASHPQGYAYLSNVPMTKANHDWHYLLSRWGMLGSEGELAVKARALGDSLMLIGIIGSTLGYYMLFRKKPTGVFFLLAIGSAISILYFSIGGSSARRHTVSWCWSQRQQFSQSVGISGGGRQIKRQYEQALLLLANDALIRINLD
ncbi:MAG TPA: hypothetical protein VJI13_02770 [Candidatus Norongarragalinales archaeon]|nr:hypothetical protein [Candidatus Norongarragalinales archaeon]